MSSVRIVFVAVAGVWTAGCTQVHLLGQLGESAQSADSSSSSDAPDTTDSSSTSADGSTDSETGDDSSETDEQGSETGGPIPDACDVVDLGGNDGVSLDIVLMTQWDAGACHEFYMTNETPDDLIWTRDLRFGGTLDNYWNADGEQLSPTDWRFAGQASADNVVVLSGKTVVFGSCMACMPDG